MVAMPNDAVENLVVADRRNGSKSDHLPATAHLARWRLRVEIGVGDLWDVASQHRWLSSPERSTALVRTIYRHLAAGTPLWLRGNEFEFAVGPVLP